jgi:hypothetical protein
MAEGYETLKLLIDGDWVDGSEGGARTCSIPRPKRCSGSCRMHRPPISTGRSQQDGEVTAIR